MVEPLTGVVCSSGLRGDLEDLRPVGEDDGSPSGDSAIEVEAVSLSLDTAFAVLLTTPAAVPISCSRSFFFSLSSTDYCTFAFALLRGFLVFLGDACITCWVSAIDLRRHKRSGRNSR